MHMVTKKVEVEEIDHLATGQNFRIFRMARGVSIRKLADKAGLTASYISDLERGHRAWSQKLLDRLLEAL